MRESKMQTLREVIRRILNMKKEQEIKREQEWNDYLAKAKADLEKQRNMFDEILGRNKKDYGKGLKKISAAETSSLKKFYEKKDEEHIIFIAHTMRSEDNRKYYQNKSEDNSLKYTTEIMRKFDLTKNISCFIFGFEYKNHNNEKIKIMPGINNYDLMQLYDELGIKNKNELVAIIRIDPDSVYEFIVNTDRFNEHYANWVEFYGKVTYKYNFEHG
jgi:hypothetical protein